MEHVKKPFKVFEEIHRVLKDNGVHIFMIPIGSNQKTFQYFDDMGNTIFNRTDYHKDPLQSEDVLVFTQFGKDITEILNNYGFSSILISPNLNLKKGLFRTGLDVIISIKK